MRFAHGALRFGAVIILAGALAACGTFGGNKAPKEGGGASQIGVNSFLWRASLDVVKQTEIPLASADPYGGVIITEWRSDPATPTERFKISVFILDTRLRADGLNVTVSKQVNSGGAWVDAPAAAQTEVDIENAILDRARRLRLASIGQ